MRTTAVKTAIDYKKVQNDLLKAWFKSEVDGKGGFNIAFHFSKYDGNVWVIDHGIAVYAIPEWAFSLDYDKLLCGSNEFKIEGLLKNNTADLFRVEYKCEKTLNDGRHCTIFTNGVSEVSTEHCINNDLLAYIKGDVYYKTSGERAPLFVFDSDTDKVVAMVMPIYGVN